MKENRFSELQLWSEENLGSVRTCFKQDTGEVWFVLKDVCDCMNIANARDTASRLDKEDLCSLNVGNADGQKVGRGGARKINIINESGLYNVIFISRKPEAQTFKRWVTSVVLPSIRKNGGYILGQEYLVGEEKTAMLGKIKALSEENRVLKEDNDAILAAYRAVKEKLPEENGKEVIMTKDGFIMDKSLFENEE